MSEITIRSCRPEDLPAVVALLAQLSLDELREEVGEPTPRAYYDALAQIEADPRMTVLVAERDGRVVGTVSLALMPNLSYRGRPYALLESMVVDASARGQRIGEHLIEECLRRAREAGCYKVSLTSNKQRLDAHRFYRRLGFEATHEGFRMMLG